MAITTAVAAVIGTGYGIYSGERGAQMQQKAVKRQQQAQQTAEARALSQERRGMMETNRARSKRANVETLLAAQNTGGNPTMLTGPGGVGKSTMLGE